jgi:hypothetical protein
VKTFTYESAVSPKKTHMQELKQQFVALTLEKLLYPWGKSSVSVWILFRRKNSSARSRTPVALLTCVWDASESNTNADYPGCFLCAVFPVLGLYLKLGHNWFLPDPV